MSRSREEIRRLIAAAMERTPKRPPLPAYLKVMLIIAWVFITVVTCLVIAAH
jgi:hypothetical protein